PTEVLVYDIGLSEVVARPFSYISDMDRKLFISDVSATDHTVAPEGGQLLQGIAYLPDRFADEEEGKALLDAKTAEREAAIVPQYAGWRGKSVGKRVSRKAMAASVRNVVGRRLRTVRVENVPF